MFACPNSGSEFALVLRRGLKFWKHPQEQELRPLARTVVETQRTVLDRVVFAREASATRCPIPVVAYAGERDGIVPPASAMAVFPNVGVLPGDHFSIIQPVDRSSRMYQALRADLLRFTGAQAKAPRQTPPEIPEAPPLPTPGPALKALIDALLAINEVADGPSRHLIVSQLPPQIRSVIGEGLTARLHAVSIVRTCAAFGEYGCGCLREALLLSVGEAPAVEHAVTLLDRTRAGMRAS